MKEGEFYAIDKMGIIYQIDSYDFDKDYVEVGKPIKSNIPFIKGFTKYFQESYQCWMLLLLCDTDEDDNLYLYPTTDYIVGNELFDNPIYYKYIF